MDGEERREPYVKEREIKPDGRYVIYYTFTPRAPDPAEPEPEQATPPVRGPREGADV